MGFHFVGLFVMVVVCLASVSPVSAQNGFVTDKFVTTSGELGITFIGHGSLMFAHGGKIIHVDPDSRLTDYTKLPKADILLITHQHQDHCDSKAVDLLSTSRTKIITNAACAEEIKKGDVMRNGDVKTVEGLEIRAVPAYNLVHMRKEGVPYHPRAYSH